MNYTARSRWSWPIQLALAVLLSGLITLVALWCQPNSFLGLMQGFLQQPLLIIVNALPVGLLVLVFSFAFGNVFYGAGVTNFIVGALSIANRVKIDIRNEPVVLRDLGLLQEVGGATSSFAINYPVTSIVVVIGLSVVLMVAGRFLRGAGVEKKWLMRLGGFVGSLATLVVLTFTFFSSDTMYYGFDVVNSSYVPGVFNQLGFPYCFTHHVTTYTVEKPAGFDKNEAATWETGDSTGNGAPVNVIMVMNEAFSAITELPAFTYTDETDPMQTFHGLQAQDNTISGTMVVPGFAGGTANTEFDVMTGMQTNALSPVTTSAFRAFNRNLDSLFRVFDADGYATSYIHPGDCWFYNRENVLKYLGAEDLTFIETMTDVDYKGRWVTDEYCADLIRTELDSAIADDTPLFHYFTTIQNHMSYTADKYGTDYVYPELETDLTFSEDIETLLKVYIEGVRDADEMLKTLTDDFAARNEPVVLVYYGDHLPYIGDNRQGYTELGTDYAQSETEQANPEAAYEVPYLIWANEAAVEALDWDNAVSGLDLSDTISASFLGNVVLELTGRGEDSAWFDFLGDLRREMPVVQKDFVQLSDGTTLWELSDVQQDMIDKWREWSYYKLKYKVVE